MEKLEDARLEWLKAALEKRRLKLGLNKGSAFKRWRGYASFVHRGSIAKRNAVALCKRAGVEWPVDYVGLELENALAEYAWRRKSSQEHWLPVVDGITLNILMRAASVGLEGAKALYTGENVLIHGRVDLYGIAKHGLVIIRMYACPETIRATVSISDASGKEFEKFDFQVSDKEINRLFRWLKAKMPKQKVIEKKPKVDPDNFDFSRGVKEYEHLG